MMRWRPRLAAVLFAVNLLILLLPLVGIAVLRLYETVLIRHTESELNMQGAFVASIYRSELLKHFTNEFPSLSSYGIVMPAVRGPSDNPDEPWTPVQASLDIARDKIYPPAPDAIEPKISPDALAQLVGDQLTPILLNAHKMTLTGIRVMDYNGVVVASTRMDLGKTLAAQEEVKRALQGEHVSLLRQRVGEGPTPPIDSISRGSWVRVFVAMPVIEGERVLGAVLLSRTPVDLSKALYRNRFYLLGGGAVILFVMCVVTTLTALMVTRPTKALIRQAQEVTRGGKGSVASPLKHPGTYEVDLLSRAFTEMSATLEKRGEYIRAFASNVSHEFKTPLTSIRGTAELLKDHFYEMSPEDRDRFLHILEQDADRLTRLVQRLLDLAKAEVAQPGTELTSVAEAFNRIAERFRGDDLSMTFDVVDGTPAIRMAPEVLESVLSNLVDNAKQHGGPRVNLRLTAKLVKHYAKDAVEIVVQDDGRGVSASDVDKIFKPFFTTGRESGSTGLGLSIIQALIIAHHGTIAFQESRAGARFRIILPTDDEELIS